MRRATTVVTLLFIAGCRKPTREQRMLDSLAVVSDKFVPLAILGSASAGMSSQPRWDRRANGATSRIADAAGMRTPDDTSRADDGPHTSTVNAAYAVELGRAPTRATQAGPVDASRTAVPARGFSAAADPAVWTGPARRP